jgi:DNA-binding NarL/FixJ family response regulator
LSREIRRKPAGQAGARVDQKSHVEFNVRRILLHWSGGIAMTVQHQEPLILTLLRGLQNLSLSPVQKQVALLLAQGASNDQIREHLHIKLSTTKEHISKIFDKLGIYRREELLPLLLALDKSKLRVL